jgi:hypothetical protein
MRSQDDVEPVTIVADGRDGAHSHAGLHQLGAEDDSQPSRLKLQQRVGKRPSCKRTPLGLLAAACRRGSAAQAHGEGE